jgi:arylsulfatase A-like enzyme
LQTELKTDASADNAEVRGAASASLCGLLLVATGFGIFTGWIEGLGLLLFQRINWAQWGRIIHVSPKILWLSPLVDLTFFSTLAFLVWTVRLGWRRMPALPILGFLLTFFAVYDWLTLTHRLYHRACLLLALGSGVAVTRWLHTHERRALEFCMRSAPWLFALLLLAMGAIEGVASIREQQAVSHLPSGSSQDPNVIVIVVDTLRADHLSCYGYRRATSPQIDRIAQSGVLFENAIAPSSWSLPSHASFLTGRYPHEHGLDNVQPPPLFGWEENSLRGYPTIGEALQQYGYRTAAFSANRIYFTRSVGLGGGFIHFEDYFQSPADAFIRTVFGREFARLYLNRSEKSKFTRAFRRLGMDSWLDKDSEGSGDYGGAYGVRKRADEVNRELLNWIDKQGKTPFLAFLNYLDVHYSYGGPRDYPKPAWDQGSTMDEYDAGIKYVDDSVGHLVRELSQRGLADKTLLVITSDHGEALGGHGLTYHGASLYRELIWVPLIISYPKQVPVGLRLEPPVSAISIPATIMNIVGAGGSNLFPGDGLDSFWNGSLHPHDQDPISELARTDTIVPADRAVEGKVPIAINGWMKAVVTSRWHWIVHEKLGNQLYDWTTDPEEVNNIANTAEGKAVISRLSLELAVSSKSDGPTEAMK